MKGWRTLLISLVVAIVGVLQTFDWASVIPPDYVGPILWGLGVLMGGLRLLTNTPAGQR